MPARSPGVVVPWWPGAVSHRHGRTCSDGSTSSPAAPPAAARFPPGRTCGKAHNRPGNTQTARGRGRFSKSEAALKPHTSPLTLQTALISALRLTEHRLLLACLRRETAGVLQTARTHSPLLTEHLPAKCTLGSAVYMFRVWQRPIELIGTSLPLCNTGQLHQKKQCRRKGHVEPRETSLPSLGSGGPLESSSNFKVSPARLFTPEKQLSLKQEHHRFTGDRATISPFWQPD